MGQVLELNWHLNKKKRCFVFHGNLENPKSIGTNNLIKKGAKLVTSPKDIIINYKFLHKNTKDIKQKIIDNVDIGEEYKNIYNIITTEPIDINEITKLSKNNLKETITKLTVLEIEGKIKKVAGNRYVRCST